MIPVKIHRIHEMDVRHFALCELETRNGRRFCTPLKVFRTPDVKPGHGYILTATNDGRSRWVALLLNNFAEGECNG